MEYWGIDVSSWNGKPDWKKVRESGKTFAILRITEKYGVDTSFEHNFAGCKANGIQIGVYKFSYARTVADAKAEADGVVETLAGRGIDFPVFLDLEWNEQRKLPKETLSLIVKTFWSVIYAAGYKFGVYTNKDWYNNVLPDDAKKYPLWVACYPSNDTGNVVERLRPAYGVGWQYSGKGKVPGIQGDVDMDVFYTDFSSEVRKTGIKAEDAIAVAESWVGKKESDNTHRAIIDLYNSHKPLARGYKVQYTDAWCDTMISALYIYLSAVYAIGGTECGVEEHVKLFKKAGIWIEDGTITPKPGDLIVYNWDKASQPNDGYADHIGIVVKVTSKTIYCIEGNYKDAVSRRQIPIGYGYIRGFARPKYVTETEPEKAKTATTEKEKAPTAPDKKPKWVGRVTASRLNVRSWAGMENPNIKSYPYLSKWNLVDVCDTVKAADGSDWYYVRIAGQYYGFVSSKWITKN